MEGQMLYWRSESVDQYAERQITRFADSVEVVAHPRVHFGAIDLSDSRQLGGGFGFGIPEVAFRITTHRTIGSNRGSVQRWMNTEALLRFADRMGLATQGIAWDVDKPVLLHRGLGATTQMVVAALQGLLVLHDRPPATALELAQAGVGAESSLGVRLAFDPMPVIDLGALRHYDSHEQGYPMRLPLDGAIRLQLPNPWLAIVVWPNEVEGISGRAEEEFWSRVLPMPPSRAAEAARELLLNVIAGACTGSFSMFNAGLTALNECGTKPEEWAVQPVSVLKMASMLRDLGLFPVLSSVGPAQVVFTDNAQDEERVRALIAEQCGEWAYVTTRPGAGWENR